MWYNVHEYEGGGLMEKYYLVARDRKSKKFKFIPINQQWYLGGGMDYFKTANRLEAIDLVTSQYENERDFLKHLQQLGLVDSLNTDVFIASRRKFHDKTFIKYYEAIYDPNHSLRLQDFRTISKAYLLGKSQKESGLKMDILAKFVSKMSTNVDYRKVVGAELTTIPKKMIEAFFQFVQEGKDPHRIKFEKSLGVDSYTTLRSIIESLNRFDMFQGETSVEDAWISKRNEEMPDRRKIEEKMLKKMNPSFIDGQLDLFDMLENPVLSSNLDDGLKESLKSDIEKETRQSEDFSEIQFVSNATKKGNILFTFEYLPRDVIRSSEHGYYVDMESFIQSPANGDEKKLSCLLNQTMLSYVYWYHFYQDKRKQANEAGFNTTQLDEEVRHYYGKIGKALNRQSTLDKVYEWCCLYDQYNQSGLGETTIGVVKSIGEKKV